MRAKLRSFAAFALCLGSLICLAPLVAQAEDKVRTWTDIDGRAMEAQFLREVDGDVTFLKEGKLTTIALDRLCEQDRQLIPKLAAALELEAASTPSQPPPGAFLPVPSAEASPSAPAPAGSTDPQPSLTKKRPTAESRTWRDLRGTEVTATFVRMHGSNVVLTRGGRVITWPFYFFSQGDREYLRNFLIAQGNESLIPPPPPEGEQPAPGGPFPAAPFAGAPQMPPGGGADSPLGGARNPAEEHTQAIMAAQQEQMRAESQARREQVAANSQAMQQQAAAHGEVNQAMMNYTKSRMDAYNNEIAGECSKCKQAITRDQSYGKSCPHCGVAWQYKEDQFGHKTPVPGASASSSSSSSSSPFFAWNDGSLSLFGMSERSSYRLIFRIIIPSIIAIAFGLYRVLK